jgi:hypothetical protein
MVSSPSKNTPTTHPEFAVRRELISSFFSPPLPPSTFHDFVKKGKILPMKHIRGLYRLNASLSRLGLREIASLPKSTPTRSREDILRLAFSAIDPVLFPPPPRLLTVETLDVRDTDHASFIFHHHLAFVEALKTPGEKIAYFNGALDALVALEELGK